MSPSTLQLDANGTDSALDAAADCHVLALDGASFAEAFAEAVTKRAEPSADPPSTNPITGNADCCARAASGHAAAAVPTSVLNLRRLMGSSLSRRDHTVSHARTPALCLAAKLNARWAAMGQNRSLR